MCISFVAPFLTILRTLSEPDSRPVCILLRPVSLIAFRSLSLRLRSGQAFIRARVWDHRAYDVILSSTQSVYAAARNAPNPFDELRAGP